MQHVLGWTFEALLARGSETLSPKQCKKYGEWIERRAKKEPVAYIIGEKEFWSLDFFVNSATLIPRPDSETLIETVLSHFPNRESSFSLLDLGTGSGCLAIVLLKEMKAGNGIALDKNFDALCTARRNAARHDVASRLRFVCGDWGQALDGMFDLIIANPPYIPQGEAASLMEDVARYEPAPALFAGMDGLDAYRTLAPQLNRLIAPHGTVALEIGAGQAEAVSGLLASAGLETVLVSRDIAGIERCVLARPFAV
jgi:release factor glutamine methyltransferase